MGICNPVPIASEGNPSPQKYIENSSLTSIRNATENPNLPATDGSSVCDAVTDNPTLEPDCTPCGNGYKFIMASAQDKCLKEYDASYYARELCTTAENQRSGLTWTATDHPTSVANYTEYGYVSVIQTDSMDVGLITRRSAELWLSMMLPTCLTILLRRSLQRWVMGLSPGS